MPLKDIMFNISSLNFMVNYRTNSLNKVSSQPFFPTKVLITFKSVKIDPVMNIP